MNEIFNLNENYRLYPLQKEKELVGKITTGDFDGAWVTFEEILGGIFSVGVENIEVVKAKVLELVLILSRAMLDSGADYNKVSKINFRFVTEVPKLDTFERVSREAHQALEDYIESKPVKRSKNEGLMGRVKEFIRENYSQQLTLEEIARAVFISPYYLSHLFKQIEGISVIEYLTKVRIEKAKILLSNPNYNIYEISEKIGYKEPSYFTRVFRHKEGRTPSQYRKLG